MKQGVVADQAKSAAIRRSGASGRSQREEPSQWCCHDQTIDVDQKVGQEQNHHHDADAGTNTGKSDGGKTCAKAFVHCGILKPVKASQVPGSPEVPNTDLEPAGQAGG